MTRKTSLVVLALFLGSAAITLVPSAAAQSQMSVAMAITPPSEAVKPLQGSITFPGTTTLTVSNEGAVGSITGVTLQYSVSKQPAWASVTVSPATDVVTIAPGAGTPSASTNIPKTFQITVTATQDAPAFSPDTVEISVTATPSQQAASAKTAKASAPVFANYFSIIDLLLAEQVKIERPQTTTTFPLKVTNFGNAQTKVNFEVTDRTENLNVPVPGSVTLQSKQAGGNQISADVGLQISTPYKNGYMNEVGVVNYKVTSNYALDTKLKGDEGKVSVVVTTKGFYVPGFEPLFAIGIVGLAALVLRRRK